MHRRSSRVTQFQPTSLEVVTASPFELGAMVPSGPYPLKYY